MKSMTVVKRYIDGQDIDWLTYGTEHVHENLILNGQDIVSASNAMICIAKLLTAIMQTV